MIAELIRNRRSIRRFETREIEEEQVERILDAAKWAPSAGNLQARNFILVRNSRKKAELAEAALSQEFISDAPLVIVVCANEKKSSERYGSRGELYSIQDATASIQNILLTVHSLGLGACWVGAFDESKVKKILKIPRGVRPVAILPIGYPAESPPAPPRSMDIHQESW